MNHLSFFWLPDNKKAIFQAIENEFTQFFELSISGGKFILPPIPSVVLDIQRLSSSPNTTVKEVAECLLDDPSLTAAVLRVANTVIFNRRGIEFKDIQTAVSRLGIMRVRDIVTAQSIEQLKNSIQLDEICNRMLRESALHARELGATMVLVCQRLQQINKTQYAYLEPDKALLVGLLADIGLFSILSEYHLYISKGNYIDPSLSFTIFDTLCPSASRQVLLAWGFDQDFTSVANNTPIENDKKSISYLDVAQIAYSLLLNRQQTDHGEEQDFEFDVDGAEVMFQLSNLTDIDFDNALRGVLDNIGF